MYTDNGGSIRFYDNEVDNYKQDHYQLHWNERYNNNWSTNLGLNFTHGEGYFEQYKEDQDFVDYGLADVTIGSETVTSTNLIRRRWLDNNFYVINASANYKNEIFNALFGGSYSTYSGDHFGEIIWAEFSGDSEIRDSYYDGNGKKTDFSIFTKGTYKLDENWSLYGDLQLRRVGYKQQG